MIHREGKYYYLPWTEGDDSQLTEIMMGATERRMTYEQLFVEAAEKLNRTYVSCKSRWQKIKPKNRR